MSRLLVPALLLSAVAAPGLATTAHVHAGSCSAYTVAPHDTLYSIARYCRTSVAAVARASHVADARHIAVGQRLRAPGFAPPRPRPGPDKDEDLRGPAPDLTYSFAAGDTLYSLARWSGVSLAALMAANPGIDPQKIELGDPIRLPRGAVPPERARERERGAACPVHHDHDREPMHRDRDRAGPDRDDDDAPPPPRNHDDKPDDDGPPGM